jgi:transposase-like protein
MEVEENTRRHLDMNAWREVLQRFAEGGETISEFCRRERLCTNSFRRWRTRLAATNECASAIVPPRKTEAANFVDLGALGATPEAVPSAVKVEGAHRLELKLDLGAGMMLVLVRG